MWSNKLYFSSWCESSSLSAQLQIRKANGSKLLTILQSKQQVLYQDVLFEIEPSNVRSWHRLVKVVP